MAGEWTPLSYQQERIWYLSQLESDLGQFNVVMALDLHGVLDVSALERALAGLASRHDVLRSAIRVVDGVAMQQATPPARVSLRRIDARGRSGTGATAAVDRVTVEEKHRPFDLGRGALLRACLVTLPDDGYTLVLTVHHVAFDGWSAAVLSRELKEFYGAYASGTEPDLPQLPLRYADFAAWQRQSGEVTADVAYWRGHLDGAPHTVTFPGDRPRPATQTFRGETITFVVPSEVVTSLVELGRSADATLFMVLYAALATLMSRYGAGTDIVIGTPVANRTRPGLDDLIGCFINLLPLRIGVRLDETFRDLLVRARDVCLDAYSHQDLPYERVLRELTLARDQSQSPLFQVMLVLHNAPAHAFGLADLRVGYRDVAGTSAQMDIGIAAVPRDGRLECAVEFSTDLYDRPTVERIVKHWQRLLAEIARDARAVVGDVPLLSADEQRALHEWSAGPAASPDDLDLVGLFHRRVALEPDATALVMDDERWSYLRLSGLVDALAVALDEQGAAAEKVVVLCIPRSPALIAAVLAVLRCGAAFLTVDPALSPQRRVSAVRDSKAHVVLTTAALADRFCGLGAALITVDDVDRPGGPLPPMPALRSEGLAYVIYTSGSTGVPKAVMGTHRSLLNRLRWAWRAYPFDAREVCVQKTAVSFVDAVAEYLVGLLAGVPTVIIDDSTVRRVERFVDRLASAGVTRVVLVPSLLRAMLAIPDLATQLPALRLAMTSGEAIERRLVTELRTRMPAMRLVNLYGSSEVGADVIAWDCVDEAAGPVPIGRPIDGVVVRVVDDRLRLVPPGVVGEVLVGGVALARGYAGRPGLTASRFVPDPWGNGDRLYRTGDRARWRRQGVLEFAGRLDGQVKIRGARIELGEVEAAIHRVPGVTGCAVTARAFDDDTRLVAFVTVERDSKLDGRALREAVRSRLPDLLVPSVFVVLDALPTTRTGKVDRQGLRHFEVQPSQTGRAPATPTERVIAPVWAEVLGLASVGADDNFFDLGGHSLLITRLAARLTAALGRDVTTHLVFHHPSVAQLAAALDRTAVANVPAVAGAPPIRIGAERRSQAPSLPRFPATDLVRMQPDRADLAIEEGRAPALDAAALTYLPDSWIAAGVLRDRCGVELHDSGATLGNVITTPAGRIGVLILPCSGSQLFIDETAAVDMLESAMRRADRLGARAVSLTGLLPSASRYGAALAERMQGSSPVTITTGHPVTACAVVHTVTEALGRTARSLEDERLCALGLGSIGTSSLRLLLATQPHPESIMLCDLYGKYSQLTEFADELRECFDYRGALQLLPSGGMLPDEAYAATTIIGATSMPDVIEVSKVRPATIVVDDSYPHCFDVEAANQRMIVAADAMFIEAGIVRSPVPLPEDRYVPPWMSNLPGVEHARRRDPNEIMGCTLAAGLLAADTGLAPTLGLPEHKTVLEHFAALAAAGYGAARLQCAGAPVLNGLVERLGARR
ncbi:hypothetical protein Athai_13660 [Actinocatenispora thailandica]|uniref:Carrier domain-containing protein n=1 Tax=Actinocatenispora thailandica TaxID=227318 RepID=A0A7R7HW80_9ACTN|nr:non-ribosomal peptide synthetase [Actinocatenispora thailandica]BCJ33863.1 hypothetical protein Athai_13660 [Actinocatenispora thailandica]